MSNLRNCCVKLDVWSSCTNWCQKLPDYHNGVLDFNKYFRHDISTNKIIIVTKEFPQYKETDFITEHCKLDLKLINCIYTILKEYGFPKLQFDSNIYINCDRTYVADQSCKYRLDLL